MHFSFHRRLAHGLALASCLGAAASSLALEPATPLNRLARQSWTMESGLPQNTISVLLQARSGFVWAGTELGLARFDGAAFRVLDHATTAGFPDAEIRCLLDDQDGSLWIGTGDGLVHWQNGHATLLTTRDGLPGNSIRGLVKTSDGTVWVWTEAGLARWVQSSAKPAFGAVEMAKEQANTAITSMAADQDGSLWVANTRLVERYKDGRWQAFTGQSAEAKSEMGASLVAEVDGGVLVATPNGVFLLTGGQASLVLTKALLPLDGVSFLSRLADGAVAVASKSAVVLARGNAAVRLVAGNQLPGSRIEALYADREGCLWIGTNHGLARIAAGGASVQLLPSTDPLAASSVGSIFEDREGDLWVGTETAGLHILRDAHFRMLGAAEGLTSDNTTAIIADGEKNIWIGTRDAGLNVVSNGEGLSSGMRLANGKFAGQITNFSTANGLNSNVILSLAVSVDGAVWVGTPDGLDRVNRMGHRGVVSYTSADGLPDDFIRSLLAAPDNSLWIGTRRGLTHLDLSQPSRGRFQNWTQADGLGSDLVGAMARTADGDLWIATLNGLTRLRPGLRPGRLQNFTTADGLSSNVITALDVTSDNRLWVGTQSGGLNLWDGQRFHPVRDAGGRVPSGLHAVLHDDLGYVWMASDFGLVRASQQALEDCALRGKCSFSVASYTTADGLRSRQASSNSHPTACRSQYGELWFTTPRGVAIADPRHFGSGSTVPPVAIERFAVDDVDDVGGASDTANGSRIRIRAGHLRFQFDYAGLSFAAPQKLRYQYMLEGFDHVWTDAGTRKTAYYTNIPPGHYRFRVRTTAGDQSPSETSLAFDLLPHFYQTAWFVALLVLLGVALLVVVFRRRVMHVEREFRAVMAERSRIAREIHDTLAQGYVGVSVQLEVLGELLRQNRIGVAAKHLEIAKAQVREGLDDARQSIWALRSQDSGEQTFPVRLKRVTEKAATRTLATSLDVYGAYRPLGVEIEREFLRIAQEAIQNAARHSGASHLTLRIEYGERMVALIIADDGRGFALSSAPGQAQGHYGLTGMRERTALIRGRIEIQSEPGEGTRIRIEVPAPAESGPIQAGHAQVAGQGSQSHTTDVQEDQIPTGKAGQ